MGAATKAAWSRKLGKYMEIDTDGKPVKVDLSATTNYSFASQTFYGTQQ
jgi:hypothetical protein